MYDVTPLFKPGLMNMLKFYCNFSYQYLFSPFVQEFECTVKLMEITLQTGPLQKAEEFLSILLNLEKDLKTPGITRCMKVDTLTCHKVYGYIL